MIDFKPSTDYKTTIVWQGERCVATVDVGTVDATSAVQLRLLIQKLNVYPDIQLEFNEYKAAIVQWHKELYGTRTGVFRDALVDAARRRVDVLRVDLDAYNHHCAIIETAEEAKVAGHHT